MANKWENDAAQMLIPDELDEKVNSETEVTLERPDGTFEIIPIDFETAEETYNIDANVNLLDPFSGVMEPIAPTVKPIPMAVPIEKTQADNTHQHQQQMLHQPQLHRQEMSPIPQQQSIHNRQSMMSEKQHQQLGCQQQISHIDHQSNLLSPMGPRMPMSPQHQQCPPINRPASGLGNTNLNQQQQQHMYAQLLSMSQMNELTQLSMPPPSRSLSPFNIAELDSKKPSEYSMMQQSSEPALSIPSLLNRDTPVSSADVNLLDPFSGVMEPITPTVTPIPMAVPIEKTQPDNTHQHQQQMLHQPQLHRQEMSPIPIESFVSNGTTNANVTESNTPPASNTHMNINLPPGFGVEDVITFVTVKDPSLKIHAHLFRENHINGFIFLELTDKILAKMNFKLGPSLKILKIVKNVKGRKNFTFGR